MEEKIRARSFSRRFLHMRGTIWEWNVEKLEGGGSQILQTSHLHGVFHLETPYQISTKLVEKRQRYAHFSLLG